VNRTRSRIKEERYLFERIAIPRQSSAGSPIDLGLLAECLLFYGKVRILADQDLFKYLVRCCGPDELLELISMHVLEIEFFDNLTAVGQIQTNIGLCLNWPFWTLNQFDSHKYRGRLWTN
jgi:hypothetical protein